MCVLDIDECALTSVNSGCLNGGSCMNIPGSFMCSCSSGFTDSRCETGAPPLLRVELTLWTVRFDAFCICRHWQLLNSRIVYTWRTCLLCKVAQRFCQLRVKNCTMQDARSSAMFESRKQSLQFRSYSKAINSTLSYPQIISCIPYPISQYPKNLIASHVLNVDTGNVPPSLWIEPYFKQQQSCNKTVTIK